MTRDRTPSPPPLGAVDRRTLLRAGGGLVAAASLAGCGFFDTEPEGGQSSGGSKGREAPALKKQADAGKLPKVADRLPDTPLKVTPLEKTGAYGGTWHSAMVTQEDVTWLHTSLGYEPLVAWAADWQGVAKTEMVPNVCEKYEVRGDGKEFVFTLRPGLKWSDGEPVTTDDFEFAFRDYNTDADINNKGVYELWLSKSGKPARFEKVDERTVRYVYDEPKPGFLEEIAGTSGVAMLMPAHYLRQFHPGHGKNAEALAKKAGHDGWTDYMILRVDPWANPDLPTLNPWVARNEIGEGSSLVAERNPYYWKVDPDGSQLPYIDKVIVEIIQDVEVEVLKVTNGDLDMQLNNFGTIRNKPVIARSRDKGGYRLIEVEPDLANTVIIGFNQTHPNPEKRRLFANKDFRIGLSHAIDRQKIIDTIFGGQGEPWQCGPVEGNELYDAELGTQYTEYSETRANQALDRAGFTRRGGDGVRRTEDGDPLSFTVLVVSDQPDQVDALDLIRADWKKVGVEANIQRLAETLYWERVEAGQSEAASWQGGSFDLRTGAGGNHYYLPSNPRGSSRFGGEWAKWYTRDGKDGERPPARIREQLDLFDRMRATFDPKEALGLAQKILDITKEQFYYIGISTPPSEYGIVRTHVHNVPKRFSGALVAQAPGPSNPSTYFFSGKA
ncbi:ABC transporter substrate-binding protein [Streptomyces olivaceus]|uniref:ABC transporter substrate-binding protein n=1 Tax=Streptomyces olivaceus TaxID=47716 RepID=UPI001CCAC7D1|nr:ABC transporter substrate-binding protein [Streptomyces olivaceus]MBZ6141386.1 ABC transporter substrate-binding protein [Streptomyces olivaceus]MBZ6169150.1 ABC transporter substrate-binding protein [Streptomyces olivaceus]